MDNLFAFLQQGTTAYTLGRNPRTGQRVGFADNNRCTYVIGRSGMGKSNLLTNLILTDIEKADRSVIVLDPHNELVESVALRCPPEQAHRVTYFAPSNQIRRVLGINPFALASDSQQEFELRAEAIMQVFAHTWNLNYANAPTMQNTLETFIRTLLANYGQYKTSLAHMLCLAEKEDVGNYWREKLSAATQHNLALSQNWREWQKDSRREKDIDSSRQKIKHILVSDLLWPILCQPTSSACFDFPNVLRRKGVLLVALGGLEKEFIRLLGSFILTQLLVAVRLHQKEEDAPCNVYADEFYYFNPQSFQFIIDEGRKFNLFCTLANQNLAQISNRRLAVTVQGCDNIVAFGCNPEDAARLRHHFITPSGFIKPQLVSNLPRYQALVRYAQGKKRPQAWLETFKEARQPNRQVVGEIWQQSLAFGRRREEIERIKEGIERMQPTTGTASVAGQPVSEPLTEKSKLRTKTKEPKVKPGFTA